MMCALKIGPFDYCRITPTQFNTFFSQHNSFVTFTFVCKWDTVSNKQNIFDSGALYFGFPINLLEMLAFI